MPLVHERDPFPAWCELQSYTIFRLGLGETVTSVRRGNPTSAYIVGRGSVTIEGEVHEEGAVIVPETYPLAYVAGPDGATVIHLVGRWGEDIGGLGLFGVREVDAPSDAGDPVPYPKATAFDAHYHDCDEYWIVFEGHGTAVSEGKAYEVGPGDCIATGMGHHHDFPQAPEPVRAVFFETTMEGQKRRGHLWEHTHGPAQPQPDRA